MIHFFVLLISIVLFEVSDDTLRLEFSLVIIVPYFVYLITQLKSYRGKVLVPPFLLTLYTVFSIVAGAFVIKYGLSVNILQAYGFFSEASLNRCIYISVVGVSSCWFAFSLLMKISNPYAGNESFSITPLSLKDGMSVVVISILAFLLLLVYTGNFGYYAQDSELSNYTEKVYQFILLIVSFYFLYDKRLKHKVFYYSVVIILCLLGLFSGSKSLLLLPVFTLYVIESLRSGKWTNKYLKYIPILFVVAFILIIPIRNMLRSGSELSTQESISLIKESSGDLSIGEMVIEDFVSRINYVPVLSVALENEGRGPENVQKLWEYTMFSPVYAFIPRFIYKDKPSNTFSNWYASNLMGSTDDNHMSASYQGILYMNGGILSVIMGFLLVGVLFYFLYYYYFQEKYIYIYLAQVMDFVVLPAEPWVLYVTVIQNFVLYYILHKLIVKNENTCNSYAWMWKFRG